MLEGSETFKQRKALLLNDVKTTRTLLHLLQDCRRKFGTDKQKSAEWTATIRITTELFTIEYNKIIELEKWKKKVGIGDDEEHRLFIKKT